MLPRRLDHFPGNIVCVISVVIIINKHIQFQIYNYYLLLIYQFKIIKRQPIKKLISFISIGIKFVTNCSLSLACLSSHAISLLYLSFLWYFNQVVETQCVLSKFAETAVVADAPDRLRALLVHTLAQRALQQAHWSCVGQRCQSR